MFKYTWKNLIPRNLHTTECLNALQGVLRGLQGVLRGLQGMALWLGLFGFANLALAQTPSACATPVGLCNLHGYQLRDLRALGMGNAYGPIARGEGALRYNPAGLVQQPNDLKLEVGVSLRGTDTQFLRDAQSALSSEQAGAISEFLNKYHGTNQSFTAEVGGNFIWNRGKNDFGFGVMALDVRRVEFDFVDAGVAGLTPLTDRLVLTDATLSLPMIGLGYGLFDKALLIGLVYKKIDFTTMVHDNTYAQYVLDSDLTNSSRAVVTAYQGNAFDIGVLWRLPQSTVRPAVSITGQNINSPTLTQTKGVTSKLSVLPAYNMGVSLSPTFGVFHLLLSVEMHDVLGKVKIPRSANDRTLVKRSTDQRMHYGAELGLVELATGDFLVALRGGRNQGYLSMGAELNLFHVLRLSYTEWTDDIGHAEKSSPQERQAAYISLGFGF